MSLQLWTSFNNTHVNNGLDACKLTGGSFSTGGKIGQYCLSGGTVTGTCSNLVGKQLFSIAMWVYAVSSTVANDWTCLFRLSDGSSSIRFEICPKTSSWTYTVNNNSANVMISGALTSGKNDKWWDSWHHMTMTCDGDTAILYMDGVETSRCGAKNSTALTGYFQVVNNDKVKKNDLRIYDHCLSPKEVSDIAKGLVVHYPLNELPIGANLIQYGIRKYTYDLPYVLSSKGSDANTSGLKLFAKNLTPGKLYTLSLCTSNPISSSHGYSSGKETTGEVTLWFYVYKTNDLMDYRYNPSGDGDAAICFTSNSYNFKSLGNNRYSWTYTIPTGYLAVCIRVNSYSDGTTVVSSNYWDFKIEEGSIATQYTSDGLVQNIHDCSGYDNDGTVVGTLTTSSDTPRYDKCTVFTSDQYIKINNLPSFNLATYSFWIKPTSTSSYSNIFSSYSNPTNNNGIWLAHNTEGSALWSYRGAVSPYYNKGGGTINTNTWYHVVFKYYDGKSLWYLNGSQQGSEVTYTNTDIAGGNYAIGDSYIGTNWGGTPYVGSISDFRIYSTALSSSDILDLYQTSAFITDNGTLEGYLFEEGEEVKIEKSGKIISWYFNELNNQLKTNNLRTSTYKPSNNGTNQCTSFGNVELYSHGTYTIELDVEWTKFTLGTGGTFNIRFLGSLKKTDSTSYGWTTSNIIADRLNSAINLKSVTLNAAGSLHVSTTFNINDISTYNGYELGCRADYSDGTGLITFKNVVISLEIEPTRFSNKIISANQLIEI